MLDSYVSDSPVVMLGVIPIDRLALSFGTEEALADVYLAS